MKKYKKLLIFVLLVLFLFSAKNVFAVNCSQIGNTTFCDNGTRYNQIGNTVFGSDGSHYNQIGNTTFGNDGTYYNQIGNTTFGSNGTRYNQIGSTIFGSDGSHYNQIGNTTFGSGGGAVINSCPANSSYDFLSNKCKCNSGYKSDGSNCVYNFSYLTKPTCPINSYYDGISSCKCNYGYVASGSSCIYKNTNYLKTPTYPPPLTKSNCPLNSHTSTTDLTKCQCNSGYQANITKNGCSIIPVVPVKTNDQICKGKYGLNSFGLNFHLDGTKTNISELKCGCNFGYFWNEKKTSCVLMKTTSAVKI